PGAAGDRRAVADRHHGGPAAPVRQRVAPGPGRRAAAPGRRAVRGRRRPHRHDLVTVPAVRTDEVVLHGHRVSYRRAGEGPVLVSSGGLGDEVHPLLRAATLPGSEYVLPLIAHSRLRTAGEAMAGVLRRVGLRAGPDLTELARGYGSLSDAEARMAFIHS